MDLSSLRALVTQTNFDVHGLDATVTVPGEDPVQARVVWVPPDTDLQPDGASFRRAEPKRVVAIQRSEVAEVPRGTLIEAPEPTGGAVKRWQVDGTLKVEVDHVRVTVVLAPEA